MGGMGGGNPFDDFEDDDEDFDFGDIFGGEFDGEDEDDPMAMLRNLFGGKEEDLEPIKNPRFKDAETVKIMSNTRPDFYPQINFKGFSGRITDSYMEEGKECYVLEYDYDSLAKLPLEYISAAVNAGQTFDEYTFGRDDLKMARLKFDEDKTEELRYELGLKSAYMDEKPEIQKVIFDALLRDYESEENENWLEYFNNHLKMPLHAKTRGLLEGYRKGTKFQIIKPVAAHPDFGIIVLCLKGKQEMPHPLMDLAVAKKADKKMEVILDAYSIWQEQRAGFM